VPGDGHKIRVVVEHHEVVVGCRGAYQQVNAEPAVTY
jgi:hypothetical protein